jgi:rRNA maturation RNase YbeY
VVNINIINDYGTKISFKNKSIENLINELLNQYSIAKGQLSIILSNKTLLNKLKKDYFNLNHFTDVIAFNLEDEGEPLDGEIYISIDDVYENSKKYNVSFNNEFKRVLIHGILHLLGFNDQTKKEKEEMTKLENINMSLILETLITINK